MPRTTNLRLRQSPWHAHVMFPSSLFLLVILNFERKDTNHKPTGGTFTNNGKFASPLEPLENLSDSQTPPALHEPETAHHDRDHKNEPLSHDWLKFLPPLFTSCPDPTGKVCLYNHIVTCKKYSCPQVTGL